MGPADRVDGRREFADTMVFCAIAAGSIGITTLRDFVTYVALGWVYKTAVEVVVLPVTYRVIAFIKRREPTYQPAPSEASIRAPLARLSRACEAISIATRRVGSGHERDSGFDGRDRSIRAPVPRLRGPGAAA